MSDGVRAQRIAALGAMLEADADDGFALYGLAMEHKVADALEEAEPLLRRLLELEPGHHYAYYQLGDVLIADGREDEAEEVLDAGIARAEQDGAAKALGELLALRDQI